MCSVGVGVFSVLVCRLVGVFLSLGSVSIYFSFCILLNFVFISGLYLFEFYLLIILYYGFVSLFPYLVLYIIGIYYVIYICYILLHITLFICYILLLFTLLINLFFVCLCFSHVVSHVFLGSHLARKHSHKTPPHILSISLL